MIQCSRSSGMRSLIGESGTEVRTVESNNLIAQSSDGGSGTDMETIELDNRHAVDFPD